MKAIEISRPGGPEVLQLADRERPEPGRGEVLVKVVAAGLNNGDLMQRRGLYPVPPGTTDIPGLEVSGTIVKIGDDAVGWQIGDTVCALLSGGGYAEYAVAPAGQCLPVPAALTLEQAAGLPETLMTCWMTLVDDGGLQPGHVVLIHGGSSGIGTTGIQLAKLLGATVVTTAGTEAKCEACRTLGADLAVNYRKQDYVAEMKAAGMEANIVLDMVGGDYVPRDMEIMAFRGRHINIGLLGGISAQISLAAMMTKQLTLLGSALRGRSAEEKGAMIAAMRQRIGAELDAGRIIPPVHASLPLAEAAEAHRMLEAGDHIGKIILTNQE